MSPDEILNQWLAEHAAKERENGSEASIDRGRNIGDQPMPLENDVNAAEIQDDRIVVDGNVQDGSGSPASVIPDEVQEQSESTGGTPESVQTFGSFQVVQPNSSYSLNSTTGSVAVSESRHHRMNTPPEEDCTRYPYDNLPGVDMSPRVGNPNIPSVSRSQVEAEDETMSPRRSTKRIVGPAEEESFSHSEPRLGRPPRPAYSPRRTVSESRYGASEEAHEAFQIPKRKKSNDAHASEQASDDTVHLRSEIARLQPPFGAQRNELLQVVE